jgi:hypothetical protein
MRTLRLLGLFLAVVLPAAANAASLLKFDLSSSFYSASWTLPSEPTPDSNTTTRFIIRATGDFGGGRTSADIEFYAAAQDGGLALFDIDTGNGLANFFGDITFAGTPDAPLFSPGVYFLTEANQPEFPGRGELTITSLGTAAVPEPAAWALMIAGFGLVGAAARRRTVRAIA